MVQWSANWTKILQIMNSMHAVFNMLGHTRPALLSQKSGIYFDWDYWICADKWIFTVYATV